MGRIFHIDGRDYRWANKGERFDYWLKPDGTTRPRPQSGIASVDYPQADLTGCAFGAMVLVQVGKTRGKRRHAKQARPADSSEK